MFFACSSGPLIQNHVWTKIIGTGLWGNFGTVDRVQGFSCTFLSPHVFLHCFPQKTRVGFTLTTNFIMNNHHRKPNQKPKKDFNTSLLSHNFSDHLWNTKYTCTCAHTQSTDQIRFQSICHCNLATHNICLKGRVCSCSLSKQAGRFNGEWIIWLTLL